MNKFKSLQVKRKIVTHNGRRVDAGMVPLDMVIECLSKLISFLTELDKQIELVD